MNSKDAFIQQLTTQFPELSNQHLDSLIADNLISPFTLKLPTSLLLQAQQFIRGIFEMRTSPSYLSHYDDLINKLGLSDPGNNSIMMSYDFHVDENQNLKLIEINTNAAFLILGHQLYKTKSEPLPVPDFDLSEIGSSILNELKLQGKRYPSNLKIAIIDDVPEKQRLFIEFLVYQQFFKSLGWDCQILDFRSLFKDFSPNFVYNRFTDFFLNGSESYLLKQKFLTKEICLSPNPYEYALLADKQRMIDWVQEGFLESHIIDRETLRVLRNSLPKSYDLNPQTAEQIWSMRKKLFLKPKNAYGSKQSFRGSSISRKAFEDLLKDDTIAQEFIPAPEQTFETPTGPQNFKFDLRCYAYQGRLQMVIARLYQGQVTNLRTTYGGFATVIFD